MPIRRTSSSTTKLVEEPPKKPRKKRVLKKRNPVAGMVATPFDHSADRIEAALGIDRSVLDSILKFDVDTLNKKNKISEFVESALEFMATLPPEEKEVFLRAQFTALATTIVQMEKYRSSPLATLLSHLSS